MQPAAAHTRLVAWDGRVHVPQLLQRVDQVSVRLRRAGAQLDAPLVEGHAPGQWRGAVVGAAGPEGRGGQAARGSPRWAATAQAVQGQARPCPGQAGAAHAPPAGRQGRCSRPGTQAAGRGRRIQTQGSGVWHRPWVDARAARRGGGGARKGAAARCCEEAAGGSIGPLQRGSPPGRPSCSTRGPPPGTRSGSVRSRPAGRRPELPASAAPGSAAGARASWGGAAVEPRAALARLSSELLLCTMIGLCGGPWHEAGGLWQQLARLNRRELLTE
jgi:hypothetical protein